MRKAFALQAVAWFVIGSTILIDYQWVRRRHFSDASLDAVHVLPTSLRHLHPRSSGQHLKHKELIARSKDSPYEGILCEDTSSSTPQKSASAATTRPSSIPGATRQYFRVDQIRSILQRCWRFLCWMFTVFSVCFLLATLGLKMALLRRREKASPWEKASAAHMSSSASSRTPCLKATALQATYTHGWQQRSIATLSSVWSSLCTGNDISLVVPLQGLKIMPETSLPPESPSALYSPLKSKPGLADMLQVKAIDSRTLKAFIDLHCRVFPQLHFHGNFMTGLLKGNIKGYLVYVEDSLVGAFSFRQSLPNVELGLPRKRTYISSLCIVQEFQGRGLGRALLRYVLSLAAAETSSAEVLLHVHVGNAKAYALYESEGFIKLRFEPGYYEGYLDPPDAHLMACVLPPSLTSP